MPRMRTLVAVLALASCHVIERNDIVRPGARERVRDGHHQVAKRPTIQLTDRGTLRFIEPLECPTEDVIQQVGGTEVVTKPNLATFVVGIVATAIGGVSTIRGGSDADPKSSPFLYGGIALVGGGLPFVIGPWLGNHTELVPGQPLPPLRAPGPPEPCGERPVAAKRATLQVRGIEIRGNIDTLGEFSISPYQLIDAFETSNVPAWDIVAEIETDAGLREVTGQIDGGSLAGRAKTFLSTATFATRIEPMRLVPGLVPGTLRVSLGKTSDGPTVVIGMPIKNDGPGPAWAVRGHVTAPTMPAIDGRVIYVGSIQKGETKEAILRIPVSAIAAASITDAQLQVSVELRDAHGTAPATPIRFSGKVAIE
jgi:hypothetical protein